MELTARLVLRVQPDPSVQLVPLVRPGPQAQLAPRVPPVQMELTVRRAHKDPSGLRV
jgi:hypothetical protein